VAADPTSSNPRPAPCPRCGEPLAAGARFCQACGNALDPLPSESSQSTAERASRTAPWSASQLREAMITVAVLVVAAVVVLYFLVWRGAPGTLFPAATTPPPGEIWFGDSYDATTFVLRERWTSVAAGRQLAAVAHTARQIAADGGKLRIELDGSIIADEALANLTGPGNLIGFTFSPPSPGTYTFSVVATDTTVLATGSITAQ
jgi:zinc-ribbon domain